MDEGFQQIVAQFSLDTMHDTDYALLNPKDIYIIIN